MPNTLKLLQEQKKPAFIMLLLGFSAGVPILLIFSSLSLWLREAGVSKSAVTYFSWAALGYSFKFVWAPLVDQLRLPLLTDLLGRRRAWLLLSQFMVILSILAMAMIDPLEADGLTYMALAAVALGFSSATQDIVIDAFRIEVGEDKVQALLSATYIAGYRIGMLVAGAGALFIAAWLGTTTENYVYEAWRDSYLCMAAVMLIGVLTTLFVAEPVRSVALAPRSLQDQLRFVLLFLLMVLAFIAFFILSADIVASLKEAWMPGNKGGDAVVRTGVETLRLFAAFACAGIVAKGLVSTGTVPTEMVQQSYVQPVMDFFSRYGRVAWLILFLVGFYRVSDIVMGAVANVFYQDMGYDKVAIASVSKVYGLWCTIIGGFIGGLWCLRFGVMRILMLGAVLSAVTNLLFMLLANGEPSMSMLALVISADNLSAGLASAAFIAYLSSLVNVSFTAMQYALFSSLMTLMPKLMAGYSGSMVEQVGYGTFFTGTALLGLPVLLLVYLVGNISQFKNTKA